MTKTEKERLIRNVTFRRSVARWIMAMGLMSSLGANVLESWDLGWLGWVLAALPPLALFGCLALIELLGRDIHICKLIVAYVVLGGIALMAGYASYVHIYRLSYGVTHDVRYSAMVPLMIDFPMILCSVLLSEARKTLARVQVPAPRARAVATTTAGARGTQSAPVRTRGGKAPKIIQATA